MKKIIFMIFCAVFLFSAISVFAGDKVTVAVLDLDPKGVPKIAAMAVSDIIRAEFVNIANFTVVERAQMKAILEEQSLQMTGCTDASCAVQFGKILSAKRIVIGEVTKLGKGAIITARYVDVAKGTSLFSAKDKADTIDDIDKAAERLAKNLAQRIVDEDKEVLSSKTMTEYYVRSILPGLGQFYADKPVQGIISATLFVGSGIAAYFMYADYKKKDDDYHNLDRGSVNFDSKYDAYEKAGLYFDISLYVVGAVYLLHWIDVLFIARPDFGKPTEAEAAFNSAFYNFDICAVPVSETGYDRVFKAGAGMRF